MIFEIKEVYHYLIVFRLLVLFDLGKKENINDVQESIVTTISMIGNLIQSQNSLKMLYHSTNQFFHLINKIWEGVHQSIEKNKNKINCLIWTTEYINHFMLINRNLMIGDFMCNFTRKKKLAWRLRDFKLFNCVGTAVCCCQMTVLSHKVSQLSVHVQLYDLSVDVIFQNFIIRISRQIFCKSVFFKNF